MSHYQLELTSDRIDPDEIRALARDKGFTAHRALRPHLWRLIRADGSPAIDPVTHDTGFTYYDAIDFLNKEPEDRY
jgi:hypothetical protein